MDSDLYNQLQIDAARLNSYGNQVTRYTNHHIRSHKPSTQILSFFFCFSIPNGEQHISCATIAAALQTGSSKHTEIALKLPRVFGRLVNDFRDWLDKFLNMQKKFSSLEKLVRFF